ncbi:hypothetical protein GOODEAATRI_019930 [Goodea atripinnis]|uniref:Uncharacterized protein n=1 Tax=Goodea atripinnis TaxID=208336 RepID=A0ABV0NLN9_9TELE
MCTSPESLFRGRNRLIPTQHQRCPLPPRGSIGLLWGISLLAGRKWLAAIASPLEEDACRKGRWTQGQGQVSMIGTEAALADDMQVIAHNVASMTSRERRIVPTLAIVLV